ncbi:MAG: hypothetical protein JOZ61_03430 [Verrucomicrobia bacterium]|nr:hypothetical protein [Verrucomicrobiota bacterium]
MGWNQHEPPSVFSEVIDKLSPGPSLADEFKALEHLGFPAAVVPVKEFAQGMSTLFLDGFQAGPAQQQTDG